MEKERFVETVRISFLGDYLYDQVVNVLAIPIS